MKIHKNVHIFFSYGDCTNCQWQQRFHCNFKTVSRIVQSPIQRVITNIHSINKNTKKKQQQQQQHQDNPFITINVNERMRGVACIARSNFIDSLVRFHITCRGRTLNLTSIELNGLCNRMVSSFFQP